MSLTICDVIGWIRRNDISSINTSLTTKGNSLTQVHGISLGHGEWVTNLLVGMMWSVFVTARVSSDNELVLASGSVSVMPTSSPEPQSSPASIVMVVVLKPMPASMPLSYSSSNDSPFGHWRWSSGLHRRRHLCLLNVDSLESSSTNFTQITASLPSPMATHRGWHIRVRRL